MEQTHPITIDRQEALGPIKRIICMPELLMWQVGSCSEPVMGWVMDMGNGHEEAGVV